jgi:hypothetical protein
MAHWQALAASPPELLTNALGLFVGSEAPISPGERRKPHTSHGARSRCAGGGFGKLQGIYSVKRHPREVKEES